MSELLQLTKSEYLLFYPETKIISFTYACLLLELARSEGIETVLSQGVFDLLHDGHLVYLNQAKDSLAKGLHFVAVSSDLNTRKIKAVGRPIENASQRAKKLADQKSVDFVFVYPDNPGKFENNYFVERLLLLLPDFVAISYFADEHADQKAWQAMQAGIIPLFFDGEKQNSTTDQIAKLNLLDHS